MEIAEMVRSYVQTLVWPFVVLACVLAFRGQLRELLGRMRRIETLGGAAEFEAAVREVAEIAEELQESRPGGVTPGQVRRQERDVVPRNRGAGGGTGPGPLTDEDGADRVHRLVPEGLSPGDLDGDLRVDPLLDDAFRMAENLPATAIVTAQARVESYVYMFLRDSDSESAPGELSLISALGRIGVSARTLSLAQRLVDLGDRVRYENIGVTRAAAIQYIESCTVVLSEVRGRRAA